jgi:hypothetical protein
MIMRAKHDETHMQPLLVIVGLVCRHILPMQSQEMKTGTKRFWAAAVIEQKFELFRQDLQLVVVGLSSPFFYGN